MSESPSPQKRRRVINQLDSPPPREKTAEDYIERLAWSTRVNKKFNQVQFDSKFMIKVSVKFHLAFSYTYIDKI
jgi:hypothetical protein